MANINPETFIISQWQTHKDRPSWIYLIFRLAIFITFFVIWILSYTMESDANKPRWPLFLANWGMTMCVLQSFLACLMLSCSLLGKYVFDAPALTNAVLRLYKTYQIINIMATDIAFTITGYYWFYWALMYPIFHPYCSTIHFMVCSINSILMFFDFCIVSHPVGFWQFFYPVCITLVYVIVTGIFYACGGTMKDDSSGDIHTFMTWDGTAIGFSLYLIFMLSVMHMAMWLLCKARTKIAQHCFQDKADPSEAM